MNRYYGWYHDPGHIEIIQRQFESQLTKWYEAFKKPIIQMEYGADAIAGLHRVSIILIPTERNSQLLLFFLHHSKNLPLDYVTLICLLSYAVNITELVNTFYGKLH